MSARTDEFDQALPSGRAATQSRAIRVTRGHLVAVLLATLVTSVLDFSFLFDKLGKPGIWKILAFEPLTSLLIYGFCIAGMAGGRGTAERAHPMGQAGRCIDR